MEVGLALPAPGGERVGGEKEADRGFTRLPGEGGERGLGAHRRGGGTCAGEKGRRKDEGKIGSGSLGRTTMEMFIFRPQAGGLGGGQGVGAQACGRRGGGGGQKEGGIGPSSVLGDPAPLGSIENTKGRRAAKRWMLR